MDTVTEEPTKPAEIHGTAHAQHPEAIDPENDIDAKKTVLWLATALVFVVLCLWALAQVFAFSLSDQQHRKIDLAPADELRGLRSNEDYWLRKEQPVGAADQRGLDEIEQSIEATTRKIIESYSSR